MTTWVTRPNLRRMSKLFAKLAKIERQRVVCPHCGSENTCYAEDRTVARTIRLNPEFWEPVDGMVLVVNDDGQMLEMADRERILCRDCTESSGIPAMCEVIFD